MIRLVTARRRAEEFAAAVDGRTASDDLRTEHATFLALVEQLREIEQPAPRADFSADLRERLMAAAPDALSTDQAPARTTGHDAAIVSFPATNRGRRTTSAVAAACIVLGSGVGVAAASQSALPGETLYPLKRSIEHVEVAVAGSQHDKGQRQLDQAGTRISEVNDLTATHANDPSTPTLISNTLDEFTDEANDGADDLMSAYRDHESPDSIVEIRTFTDESAHQLEALTNSIPPAAADALADAAAAVRHLDHQAHDLCPSCSALPTLQLSAAMIDLQHQVTDTLADAPATRETNGTPAPSTGSNRPDRPTATQTTPQATRDSPGNQPVLPQLPTLLGPTGSSPSAGQSTTPPPGGGVITLPRLPGGRTNGSTSAPSVPLPTVDLQDPLSAVPQVIDDVTDILDLPDLP